VRAILAACLAAATSTLPALAAERTPAVDYTLQCQGCHLEDGGATPGRVPALSGSLLRFARVPGGRAYLVRVPGVAQASLDDAALAALLNWLLVRFASGSVPPDFAPYRAEEVGRMRRLPLLDVDGERRRLLGQESALARLGPCASGASCVNASSRAR
jgi:hypothetical protein